MSNKDDGGPAFPAMVEDENSPDHICTNYAGMTLRDYFAAHATIETAEDAWGDCVKSALLKRPAPANGDWIERLQFEADFRAAWKFMRADAMLEARKQ